MSRKFRYCNEKNAKLLEQRQVSFEEIIVAIENGGFLFSVEHHNVRKYPKQRVMHILYNQKVYIVPYVVEDDGTIFLKTIYPSRKATKLFLNRS